MEATYDEVAEVMSMTTGKRVEFDGCKYAYMLVVDEGENVVIGYADEDIVEIVDTLLRM